MKNNKELNNNELMLTTGGIFCEKCHCRFSDIQNSEILLLDIMKEIKDEYDCMVSCGYDLGYERFRCGKSET